MGRPRVHGPRIKTAVMLPVALHERLTAFAADRCVARNVVMETALTRFLDAQQAGSAAGGEPWDWSQTKER